MMKDFLILNSGLQSKWQNVLMGDKKWILDFEKSDWYEKLHLSSNELNVLDKYIK